MRAVRWLFIVLAGCGDPDGGAPSGQGGASGTTSTAGKGGTTSPSGRVSGMNGGGGLSAAGSSTVGGTKAGEGGSGGSDVGATGGGSGASCEQRWAEYYALAMPARLCDPNAAMPECKSTVVVLDTCGCSVPANGSSPDYLPARLLLSKYHEDCDFPEVCDGCPATLDAGCKDDGSGTYRCEYQ